MGVNETQKWQIGAKELSRDPLQDLLERVVTAKGDTGSDGLSAFELARLNGFRGSLKQWLESLRGEPGPVGARGFQGVAGRSIKGDDGLGINWRGPYQPGVTYQQNDAVEYLGSSWIALRTTQEIPGASARDWNLLAQKGQDGRGGGISVRVPIVQTLAYAPDLAINWSGVDEVRVTLTGDFAPTFIGALDGQRCMLTLTQDDAGVRLATLPANVRFSDDLPSFTATTGANKTDRLGLVYHADLARYDLVAVNRGFFA